MASVTSRCLVIFLFVVFVKADDIDVELSTGIMLKVLRSMANQTKGDTLNLPANASSIRENITDTFSCENRTYGYYADVDNECQIFHVCLPSQAPSGRNVTYRWSFICPNETIFNQEVLTCTRPIDSIPCEEAESYYDVNMEFGKIPNNTKEEKEEKEQTNMQPANNNKEASKNKPIRVTDKRNKNQKRKQNIIDIRKPNIIPEELLKDIVDEELHREEFDAMIEEKDAEYNPENLLPEIAGKIENKPKGYDVREEFAIDDDVNSRLAAERSLKWDERNIRRGPFRFKADV